MVSYDEIITGIFTKGRKSTDSAPLPKEYGDQSTLVAIDKESLLLIVHPHDGSLRTPAVQNLIDEAPDPTHIPPIYLGRDFQVGTEGETFFIRDGNHRVEEAVKNPKMPFLLAYVRDVDIPFLTSSGFVYRKVRSNKPE